MEPNFLNADLEIFSEELLDELISETGDRTHNLHHGSAEESKEMATFELWSLDEPKTPERLIHGFCDLLESLSPESKRLWQSATKVLIDLGYEVHQERDRIALELKPETLKRLSDSNIALAFTIYHRGRSEPFSY
jgi:23S rRNA A2030 N6-methylase RlmJ